MCDESEIFIEALKTVSKGKYITSNVIFYI